ncbi:MAG TPA: CsbD family protein [Pirellulaceae bacterium]|nr:CsbD family protein [Pirellulaceae bacterium]
MNRADAAAHESYETMFTTFSNLEKLKVISMSGEKDIVKGRIKEAAGVLTDDEKLRAEGKIDQAVGKVKQTAGKVLDATKDAAKKTVETAKEVAKKTADKAESAASSIRE